MSGDLDAADGTCGAAAVSRPSRGEVDAGYSRLTLYVVGTTPRSARAIVNVREICESFLGGRYSLRIIDLTDRARIPTHEQIVAVPLLIREFPLPARRFIGDMSDRSRIVAGLGIGN